MSSRIFSQHHHINTIEEKARSASCCDSTFVRRCSRGRNRSHDKKRFDMSNKMKKGTKTGRVAQGWGGTGTAR